MIKRRREAVIFNATSYSSIRARLSPFSFLFIGVLFFLFFSLIVLLGVIGRVIWCWHILGQVSQSLVVCSKEQNQLSLFVGGLKRKINQGSDVETINEDYLKPCSLPSLVNKCAYHDVICLSFDNRQISDEESKIVLQLQGAFQAIYTLLEDVTMHCRADCEQLTLSCGMTDHYLKATLRLGVI